MRKIKAFNMVEIMIVVCLLLTTVILCIPTIFNNSKEAKVISAWKQLYEETATNFAVYNVSDEQKIDAICKSNTDDKEKEIFKIISPYLNVDLGKNPASLKFYHYKYKNGAQVSMQSQYFTRLFSYQEDGDIIGFKWLSCDCNEKRPCAMVLFDMNGTKAPNRIGTDVFGFFLFKDRIEAFGANMTNEQLEEDCGKHSNGLSCSEYYLRGGRF